MIPSNQTTPFQARRHIAQGDVDLHPPSELQWPCLGPVFLSDFPIWCDLTSVTITPVSTRREKRQFLDLPWRIYQDDPHWVPPLLMNQKELLNYKRHPFYDDAEIQTFLALRDGEVCGRIAAILSHAHNRIHKKEPRGFVGFFESIDDQVVASALFDAARVWLGERGLHDVRGPMNPSMNYECGLLVQNFDMPPTFMMTYNPEYYVRLWESYGFVGVQDLFTFAGNRDHLETMESKVQFIASQSKQRFNVTARRSTNGISSGTSRHFSASTTHRWRATGAMCRCRPRR